MSVPPTWFFCHPKIKSIKEKTRPWGLKRCLTWISSHGLGLILVPSTLLHTAWDSGPSLQNLHDATQKTTVRCNDHTSRSTVLYNRVKGSTETPGEWQSDMK